MHKNVDLSGEAFDKNSKHNFSMGEEGGPLEINYVRSLLYKRRGARPKSIGCGCQRFHSFDCNDVDSFISRLTNFLNFEIFDHFPLKVSAAKDFKQ